MDSSYFVLLNFFHPFLLDIFREFQVSTLVEFFMVLLLLGMSGVVAGAEVSFFSITPQQLISLKNSASGTDRKIFELLSKPKRLLATLLITNNFLNIAIVVFSSFILNETFDFSVHPTLAFILDVVLVSFLIVLLAEVLPKVYATQNPLRQSQQIAYPVYFLDKLVRPFSWLLVTSTSFIDKRLEKKDHDVSMDELTHAIDIATDKNTPEEEKKILKGIARFANIDVKQIMKPRMDVIAFDRQTKFNELLPKIVETSYSRIPIFDGTFDKITGMLYIKDLLPYLDKANDEHFDWKQLLRPAYFVPESKRLNDLLQEFQEKKIHLAIVIDEYGGSSGIVTLEDILEEVVGEINDEFDEEELFYSKLDDRNFVFEGKALLNDVSRVMNVERKIFDIGKEDADTLAGLILELEGRIPQKNERLPFADFIFTIESSDKRKIKRIKVTMNDHKTDEQQEQDGGNNSSAKGLAGIILLLVSLFLFSCDQSYIPKPRGYFRITMPEKKYHHYVSQDCPFAFDVPDYAEVVRDSSRDAEPCWLNVEYPQFNGTLYLSYKEVKDNLEKLISDSRLLAFKHVPRASGIDDNPFSVPDHRVYGIYYDIAGNAASSVQFYLTDSTKHFLHASLYFYSVPNPDSIAPVLNFLRPDIDRMIQSFQWK